MSTSLPVNPGLSIGRVFKGHKGPVTRAIPIPSCNGYLQYASSGGDGSVIIWSTKQNTRPLRCEGHNDRVTAVAGDVSGKWVASAGIDKTIRLWYNAPSSNGVSSAVYKGCHTGVIRDIDWSHTETDLLMSCSDDKTVKLWKMPVGGDRRLSSNLQDRKFICSLVGHSNWVLTCAFSSDARSAVSGGEDRTVRVWDIETRNSLACLYENSLSVRCVTFSPVTPQLVGAAGDDGSINFWDIRLPTGKQLVQRYSPAHDRGSVLSLALRPDNGHVLASGGRQGDIRLWDLREGRRIACVAQGRAEEAPARLPPVRWCQDAEGRYELIVGSADGQVYIWDIEDSVVLPIRQSTPVGESMAAGSTPFKGYSTAPAPMMLGETRQAISSVRNLELLDLLVVLYSVPVMSRTLDLSSVTTETVPKAMEAVGDQFLVVQRTLELIEKRLQLIEDKVTNLELNLRVPPSPMKLENMPSSANEMAATPDGSAGA
ncbi:hypothetical protein FOL47_001528 [Perkinsus chesapeaki]|uniref:POC1 centriolar protein A n=1 Tax=Perkinsus chesapeaki TaxID=330153 RepID=A0A7J6MJ65_PERCH|nr:hypothetical protein FOL47_001528 [Perkinsus chesapeaki]